MPIVPVFVVRILYIGKKVNADILFIPSICISVLHLRVFLYLEGDIFRIGVRRFMEEKLQSYVIM